MEEADPLELAKKVRAACVQALAEAYEDAGVQGLCVEGRWEAAIGAVERMDLGALVKAAQPGKR